MQEDAGAFASHYVKLVPLAEVKDRTGFEGLDPDVAVLQVALSPTDAARVLEGLSSNSEFQRLELVDSSPGEGDQFSARVLRRRRGRDSTESFDDNVLSWESIALDVQAHQVRVQSTPVQLTATEFALLETLIAAPSRVFTRAHLMSVLDIGGMAGDERLLDVHCSRLRKKVEAAGGPRIVSAVRGVGYRLSDGA